MTKSSHGLVDLEEDNITTGEIASEGTVKVALVSRFNAN
jgi:hypothetical protein